MARSRQGGRVWSWGPPNILQPQPTGPASILEPPLLFQVVPLLSRDTGRLRVSSWRRSCTGQRLRDAFAAASLQRPPNLVLLGLCPVRFSPMAPALLSTFGGPTNLFPTLLDSVVEQLLFPFRLHLLDHTLVTAWCTLT